MMKIATLTINPALDKSSKADQVIPEEKIRCGEPVYEPGGGGINVSRAIKKLGGESLAYVILGGYAGQFIQDLLREEEIAMHVFESAYATRENLMIYEKATHLQYRFGMPGHEIPENEWKESLSAMENTGGEVEILVASGSVPPGVPDDYYARLAAIMKKQNKKYIVDTSGLPLKKAAEEGLCLIKPNINELAFLAGKERISNEEQEQVARQIVRNGRCEVIVVSLGPRGAMMATADEVEYIVPPTVNTISKVGAGDSMVAGMVLALNRGWNWNEVARYGVAAGTSATMTSGSQLCTKDDTELIYRWLRQHRQEKVKS